MLPALLARLRLPTLRRWAVNLLAAMLGLALTSALIGRVAPLPELSAFSDKWKYFLTHQDEFDTLFIGSSRVYRQVSPQLFDELTARGGHPTRSFNFAQNAMRPPESFYALRKILSLQLPRLRYVFIELMNIKVKLPEENRDSAQVLYWHDWHHTGVVAREVLTQDYSTAETAAQILEHYGLWLRRFVNFGLGSVWLEEQLWLPDGDEDDAEKWLPYRGWQPGQDRGLQGKARAKFLREVEALPDDRPAAKMSPTLESELRALIALVRAEGAEPIFIISPSTDEEENFKTTPGGTTLLALNDHLRYPALYDPAHYFDPAHLNPRGAALYTQLLAAKFLEAKGAAPARAGPAPAATPAAPPVR